MVLTDRIFHNGLKHKDNCNCCEGQTFFSKCITLIVKRQYELYTLKKKVPKTCFQNPYIQ